MQLRELTAYLDTFLNHSRFSDSSLNGLQVEGRATVQTVALAVDAAQATIEQAIAADADLLLTHHGLFWGRPVPITGMLGRRIGALLRAGLSLYVSHLPLDAHPTVGNNAVLVRALGLADPQPFGEYRGNSIGFIASSAEPLSLEALLARIHERLGTPQAELRVWGQREQPIKKIGIISGGAANNIEDAIAAGCDAYITGEPNYGAIFPAVEDGVPLICAGHYYTETGGVQALGAHLEQEFGLRTLFLPGPVGL